MLSPSVKRLLGTVPFLLPVLLLLPEGSYVPIFDGRDYANCIVTMATQPSWGHLSCSGHPSHGYTLFTAAIQALRPYSTWLMLTSHLALLLASLWAFRQILAHLFPGPDEWGTRTLALTSLAVHPAILACTLQPNPDLAALAGSLLVLESLLAKRFFRAALAGLFLVFTKEVGLLFLPTIVAVYAVAFVTRVEAPLRDKGRALARLWPLAVPIAAGAGRLLFLHLTHRALFQVPPTHSSASRSILSEFLSVQLLDRTFLSYAAGIGVLQFQWVQTAVVLAWTCWIVGRWLFRASTVRKADEAPAAWLSWVLCFAFFVLTTRYRTYSSPRYWLSAYPMMMLATYAGVRELRVPVAARHGLFAMLTLAFLASEFHVVDPVSRKLYGTFRFGDHDMLRASSISEYASERSSGGRDALTYNLQFANIHHLQEAVIASLPNARIPHLVDMQSDWHLWDSLDASFHRTLDPRGTELPYLRVVTTVDSLELRPVRWTGPSPIYVYVVYPMFETYQRLVLARLAKIFEIGRPKMVQHDGYSVEVYPLRFAGAGALGSPDVPRPMP
jgi:hypothetical protein